MSSFIFNEIDSRDFDIILPKTPHFPTWAESSESVTIAGRSTPIRQKTGVFEEQEFTIDMVMRVSAQAAALFYDSNNILIKSSHPTNLSGKNALEYMTAHGIYGAQKYPFEFASDITNESTAYYDNVSVTAAILGVDQCFVNRWGGEIYRDNYYFSINRQMEGSVNYGIIQYSYNMTEIEFVEDDSDLLTDLYAEDNFGNTVHISNENVPSETFPNRINKYVKFSYDVENKLTFEHDVQAYYDEYKQSKVTITVRFADLSDDEKYRDIKRLSGYEVGDRVTVYHKELDIYYSNLEIISKDFDAVAQKTIEIQIGSFKDAISRRPFMSETASSGRSAQDKENNALKEQVKQNTLKILGTWGGAKVFRWSEIKKYTWEEVNANG